MSGPEIALARCAADIVEIAAFREQGPAIEELASAQGVGLAGLGRLAGGAGHLTLSVRPARWLLLSPPAAAGAGAKRWGQALAGRGAALDSSSALAAFVLGGASLREMLARACRLDLHADAFPTGKAAATIMVQVPAILASLGPRMLLLTPASTARHLHEWLIAAAKPYGLAAGAEVNVNELGGAQAS